MNLKMHTGRLLAICTISGFLMGSGLVVGYRHVDAAAHELSAQSIALRDVEQLQTQLKTYFYMADKVLLEQETGLLDSTQRWVDEIRMITERLSESGLAADKSESIETLLREARSIQALIDVGATYHDSDRDAKLNELAARTDVIADSLVKKTDALGKQLLRRSNIFAQDIAEQRVLMVILTWISAIVYAVIVTMSWFWSVQTMVRPMERLSDAAERAKLDNDSFVVEESGPEEVRRLTRNISSFVRTRADFLATMSHELRTPLNGIINMNELMLETDLGDEQQELVRSAKSAGEALLAIINDILDFSKIQAKKLVLETAPLEIRRLVDESTDIVAVEAERKGLQVFASVDHRIQEETIGDPTRLRQILVNLLNNAVKFTNSGSISITVSPSASNPELLRFAITDTGVGIARDVQETLFRAFQQGDSSTTRRFGGTGLGLAICRELAVLMGGSIGVESAEGHGSTFWFTAHLAPDIPPSAATSPTPAPHGRRIVLASDRPEVRHALKQNALANNLGTPVVTVDRPESLCDALQLGDWVLLDPHGHEDVLENTVRQARSKIGKDGAIAFVDTARVTRRSQARAGEELALPRIKLRAQLGVLHGWLAQDPMRFAEQSDDALLETSLNARVLVVDDNPMNRRVARTFLERVGCTVQTANDGQEAIETLFEETFDIVLMDCQMPRLDGLEATRRLRKHEAEGELAAGMVAPLPILALTAASDTEDRAACRKAGMDNLLPKPFAPADLVAAVARTLHKDAERKDAAVARNEGDKRILIVDDNPMNQRVLAAIVKKAGFRVDLANDGQQAVDHLRTEGCDLVLMDCQMPVLDGWEATRVIRELESLGQLPRETHSPLPVLAVTANAMDGDREKCLEAGMNEYLTKPVKPQRVLDEIRKHLRHSPATTRS
ncbi:MAG: response regulator [Planctomycetota bacterium]